jgi:NitT/TauT family transport system ATP-binding protein
MTPGGLKVSDLRRTFDNPEGPIEVLDGISFDVPRGECAAIYGPNGSGKSTMFNALAGLDRGYQGAVEIDGRTPEPSDVGFVFQDFAASLFPWLRLVENVTFGLKMQGVDRSRRLEIGKKSLARFNLERFSRYFPYQISGGMKQRVCFVRALSLDQKLLLLDEPFSALDQAGFLEILHFIESIPREQRPPTVLISHDLDQAMLFADRVIVLSRRPAHVVEEIRVNLPRPRNVGMIVEPEFQSIRQQALAARLRGDALV